eukprot:IDg17945t1
MPLKYIKKDFNNLSTAIFINKLNALDKERKQDGSISTDPTCPRPFSNDFFLLGHGQPTKSDQDNNTVIFPAFSQLGAVQSTFRSTHPNISSAMQSSHPLSHIQRPVQQPSSSHMGLRAVTYAAPHNPSLIQMAPHEEPKGHLKRNM